MAIGRACLGYSQIGGDNSEENPDIRKRLFYFICS